MGMKKRMNKIVLFVKKAIRNCESIYEIVLRYYMERYDISDKEVEIKEMIEENQVL